MDWGMSSRPRSGEEKAKKSPPTQRTCVCVQAGENHQPWEKGSQASSVQRLKPVMQVVGGGKNNLNV